MRPNYLIGYLPLSLAHAVVMHYTTSQQLKLVDLRVGVA